MSKLMQRREGPVVFVILDGVGYGKIKECDAVQASYKPNLDKLLAASPNTRLNAHGTHVGLPSDADIGNSEVGHNAFGCGRVFNQGAMLVNEALASGKLFQDEAWNKAVAHVQKHGSKLHFIGLFSDGGVHSNIDHLNQLVAKAATQVKEIRVHPLFDGRDVGETSGMNYVTPFEKLIADLNGQHGCNIKVASGGGRMSTTMDRYFADWKMVERGWFCHVHGESQNKFKSLEEAYTSLRASTGKKDQDLPEFVIVDDKGPVGTIGDNDAVILFNYRGDRAIEISMAFEYEEKFTQFERRKPKNLFYAGIMQYDGDLKLPANFLVPPPRITRVSGEFVAEAGLTTLAISETQKFGHVTYFYNGNRSGYINEKLEKYVEIPSDNISFDLKPWMKCGEITDVVVDAILNKSYNHIRLNYPNGDMVGHTGVFEAVRCSVEALDIQLGRIKEAIDKVNGVLIISADHGNADDMYEVDKKGNIVMENGQKKVKTAHSLNQVPFLVYDPSYEKYKDYDLKLNEGLGISSIAATILDFLGVPVPSDYNKSIINRK